MEIKQHLKKLLGDSFIYGLSGMIMSFIGVFLIPLYTKVFLPSDYGIIALLTSMQSLISLVIIFGLDNSFAVWYWDKPTEEHRNTAVTNWFTFSFLAGLFFAIVVALCSKIIATQILGDEKFRPLVLLVALNILLASTQKILSMWFRVRTKPFHAVISSLIVSLILVASNIILILKIKVGLIGIFYSFVISSAVGLLLLNIVLRKNIGIKFFNGQELKKMVQFSLPLVPASLMFWLLNTATPYFLKLLIKDTAQIGLYQLGATISNVLAIAVFAFTQAFSSYGISIASQPNAKAIFAKVFHWYIILGSGIVLFMTFMSSYLLQWFTNKNYYDAVSVISILSFNIFFVGMPQILGIANLLGKNNKPIASSAFYSMIVTISGFFILIPLIGKEGAALAVLLGNILTAGLIYFKGQKIYNIPYNLKLILVTVAITIIAVGLKIIFIDK